MAKRRRTVDPWFLTATLTLTVAGFLLFISASLGLLAQPDISYSDVVLDQFFLGLLGGLGLMTATSFIHYRVWRSYAFGILVLALILTALVFVPQLGITHGGSTRWLDLGPLSFQPAEALKIAFVIYLAAWLSGVRKRVHTFLYGLLPYLVLIAVCGGLLLAQPDTDTVIIIATAGLAMFFVAGARWWQILIIVLIGAIGLAGIMFMRPYVMERVKTFLNPTQDPLDASYQIRQSLIAVGSGEIIGRGFGQSVQKFNFLPEPIGDSIFAVAAEEFGFVGSIGILALYVFFAYRGCVIAIRAPDHFSRLLVIGIVVLITVQSLLNIAAMLGVVPMSGMPLLFISHGGTALAITLAEAGIILNVSRYARITPLRT